MSLHCDSASDEEILTHSHSDNFSNEVVLLETHEKSQIPTHSDQSPSLQSHDQLCGRTDLASNAMLIAADVAHTASCRRNSLKFFQLSRLSSGL